MRGCKYFYVDHLSGRQDNSLSAQCLGCGNKNKGIRKREATTAVPDKARQLPVTTVAPKTAGFITSRELLREGNRNQELQNPRPTQIIHAHMLTHSNAHAGNCLLFIDSILPVGTNMYWKVMIQFPRPLAAETPPPLICRAAKLQEECLANIPNKHLGSTPSRQAGACASLLVCPYTQRQTVHVVRQPHYFTPLACPSSSDSPRKVRPPPQTCAAADPTKQYYAQVPRPPNLLMLSTVRTPHQSCGRSGSYLM